MREIGSFFEYPSESDFGSSPAEQKFLEGSELFASGRDVFAFLGGLLGRRKMFVPDYFCPHTASFISTYFEIVRYKDTPNEPPILPALCEGCILLAVNTFGMHSPQRYELGDLRKDVILIEDHSHAPFSKYARESDADYCMASLRKTLPLGSGAYLKAKNAIPRVELSGSCKVQDAAFYEAARKKRSRLADGSGDKAEFLNLYNKSESLVEGNNSARAIGSESKKILSALNIKKLWEIRAANFFALKDRVKFPLLNGNVSDEGSVFNPVLLLESREVRDALRSHLIEEKIYPPIHWSNLGNVGISEESKILSERVLTIPLDHRYSESDAERAVEAVNAF